MPQQIIIDHWLQEIFNCPKCHLVINNYPDGPIRCLKALKQSDDKWLNIIRSALCKSCISHLPQRFEVFVNISFPFSSTKWRPCEGKASSRKCPQISQLLFQTNILSKTKKKLTFYLLIYYGEFTYITLSPISVTNDDKNLKPF